MTRMQFIKGASALGTAAAMRCGADADESIDGAIDFRTAFQREIDEIDPSVWASYYKAGSQLDTEMGAQLRTRLPALQRYEDAFDRVVAEIKSTEVADKPAVWLVYNMGIIVKTRSSLFAVDLHHRRAEELASLLDFALITHNHGDHYTDLFYQAMDGAQKKTVISNFKDNYGAHFAKKHPGGYTRAVKTFELGDVTVRTTYADHNAYLEDFTTVFEITCGDFTIYHSGDCSNAAKLKPVSPNPDLWIVHPLCGMKPVDGAHAVNPKLTVVAHLNELGHAKGRWRWTWANGESVKAKLEEAGFAAVVPLWGDRVC